MAIKYGGTGNIVSAQNHFEKFIFTSGENCVGCVASDVGQCVRVNANVKGRGAV